jgi:aminoglycoside phosphotransferase (APT) family kinase protein
MAPKAKISSVNVWPIKVRHRTNIYRNGFVAFFDVATNEPKRGMRVVGYAGRKRYRTTVTALAQLNAQLPKRPWYEIPQPLFYDAKYDTALLTYVPGRPLLNQIIHDGRLRATHRRALVRWLGLLDRIDPATITTPMPGPQFNIIRSDVAAVVKEAPMHAPKILKAWDNWQKEYQRRRPTIVSTLAHGDFHPINVMTNPTDTAGGSNNTAANPPYTGIGVIDFDLMCPAPRFWDLASFLVQSESMFGPHLPQRVIREMRRDILATWEEENGKLSKADHETIRWLSNYFRISILGYLFGRQGYPNMRRLYDRLEV